MSIYVHDLRTPYLLFCCTLSDYEKTIIAEMETRLPEVKEQRKAKEQLFMVFITGNLTLGFKKYMSLKVFENYARSWVNVSSVNQNSINNFCVNICSPF